MKIAVLSDIHSNQFALAAVADAVNDEQPDLIVVLGDTFGYYPWAVETFRIVNAWNTFGLLGNHDQLLLDSNPPIPVPSYWSVAKHNARVLGQDAPEALNWLMGLQPSRELVVEGHTIRCCHGTPGDPLNGRYYPDDFSEPEWLPQSNDILLFGHTHHPVVRRTTQGGLLVNPGSVGQPRDGDLRASWGIVFPLEMRFELKRTEYDVESAVRLLEELDWYRIAIDGLLRNHKRNLPS